MSIIKLWLFQENIFAYIENLKIIVSFGILFADVFLLKLS